MAILGGAGVTIGALVIVGLTLSAPATRPWDVAKNPLESSMTALAGTGGMALLAVSTLGLVVAFQDRIGSGGALAGSLGAVGGILGLMGAYAMMFALPVGSAIVVWDLARSRVLSRWLAIAHIASAVGLALLIAAYMNNSPLAGTVVFALFYPLTWLAIGGVVLRGVPVAPGDAVSRA
jgi:hypothetical protein